MFFGIILLIMLNQNIVPWQGEGLPPTTGSIIGEVIDSKTNEQIPGAVVIVIGTPYGAQVGRDGRFVIYNLEPGIYNLRYNNIAYTPVIIESVYVYPSMSSISNAKLSPDIEFIKNLEACPGISRDELHLSETTTIRRISARQLEHFPATNVAEIVRKLR